MERQMDEQTDEKNRVVKEALKTRLLIIRLGAGSYQPKSTEKRGYCTGVTDGQTDGRIHPLIEMRGRI